MITNIFSDFSNFNGRKNYSGFKIIPGITIRATKLSPELSSRPNLAQFSRFKNRRSTNVDRRTEALKIVKCSVGLLFLPLPPTWIVSIKICAKSFTTREKNYFVIVMETRFRNSLDCFHLFLSSPFYELTS